jgi:hypothetical protein
MRKRRKVLVWTLIGLLFVFAVAFVVTPPGHRNSEPVYNGRTLAHWLDRANGARHATPEEIEEAEDAIRAIGTNAFPCLLEWTGYTPSLAKRRFFGGFAYIFVNSPSVLRMLVTDKLWLLTHRREMLAEKAVHGFRVLHTNAFAFEALSKMASDTNNPGMHDPAAKALLTITNTPAR